MPRRAPLGTRREQANGYISVKLAEGGKKGWRWEHQVVWEAIHGPLPEGWCIHHVDGNKTNNAPDNLVGCASNSEHFREHHAEMSREIGRKLGLSGRGRPKSPEHRAKISAALKGRPVSPEHREKISETLKGRKAPPKSEETREKLRASWTPERRAAESQRVRQRWEDKKLASQQDS